MPMLIQYTDYYLARDKRDIFFLQLQMLLDENGRLTFKYDEDTLKYHTDWLDAHGVEYFMTAGIGHICGDSGAYYLGFTGWDDPRFKAYCAEIEDENGNSKEPDKYKFCYIDYNIWYNGDGRKNYDQHLRDLEDPNYQI